VFVNPGRFGVIFRLRRCRLGIKAPLLRYALLMADVGKA
jgi:hypothetical protein